MKKNAFIDKLIGSLESIPAQADVIELKQPNIDDLHRRGRQLLSLIGHNCGCNFERGDWTEQHDSTLVHLPQGGNAVLYHPSGAMQLTTGLAPMENLFSKLESKAQLTKLVEQSARTLNIKQWVSESEELRFERLWQIKAAAGNPEGKVVAPVLCRAIGAYRHYVNGLPVLGAASVAIKVAAEGELDSLSIMARQTSGKAIDRIKTIPPEQALQRVYQQLERLMGRSKMPLTEVAMPQSIQFGYLSLSKRKGQRVLEPTYVVSVNIEGQEEAQGYLFTIAGSDTPYMPLALIGEEAIAIAKSRNNMTNIPEVRERMAAC